MASVRWHILLLTTLAFILANVDFGAAKPKPAAAAKPKPAPAKPATAKPKPAPAKPAAAKPKPAAKPAPKKSKVTGSKELDVDAFLELVEDLVLASGLQNFHPANMSFEYMSNSVSMYDGNITGIEKLHRLPEASADVGPILTSIKCGFGLPNLTASFHVDTAGLLNNEGGLAVVIATNITLRLGIRLEVRIMHLELENFEVGFDTVELKLEGLGMILSGASAFANLVLKWSKDRILGMLNEELKKQIGAVLADLKPEQMFG